ncbi:S8 family serine peptidase [Kordia sp. TARA_039_SRF]|nr:S8 family serine peptidase [Kordia sp. TARA_039_SRF]
MKSILLYIVLCSVILGCTSSKSTIKASPNVTAGFMKNEALTTEEKQHWHFKDIYTDSIPGISLDKAYTTLLKGKKGDTIIVAVLDMRIHKNHEDIKDFIWTNTDEIPNNGIDDEHNGYIDDIHGWNFLGNSKGEQAYRANFEYVRIIRKFKAKFDGKKREEFEGKSLENFDEYLRAKKVYNEDLKYTKRKLSSLKYKQIRKNFLEQNILKELPNSSLSVDALKNLKITDKKLANNIKLLIQLKKDSVKDAFDIELEKRYLDFYLNEEFNERLIMGDDINNLDDKTYGNNNVTSDNSTSSHTHAIKVAGIIAANRNNKIGIKGITNQVKIMPIAISPYGDEQDKDMALGIRYAVDNGAKIINISSSKKFSIHEEWVFNALRYAEKNDVLVVTSAGNEAENLDFIQNYPDDTENKNYEIVNNFIKVGASTHQLNESLIHYTSNYGKESVDIFAPGKNIYTTYPNNNYDYSSGTSYASPIVTGVAALIRSNYPNLSATEVKEIIINSGVEIKWSVSKPPNTNNKDLVPFSSLSKSGKIVNAYNALLLAEEISKKKKKKRKKKK